MFFSLAFPTLETFTDDVSFMVVLVKLFLEALLCRDLFDPWGLIFSLSFVAIIPTNGFLSDFSVTLDRPGEKVAVFFPVLELLIGFCFPVLDSDLTAVLFPEIMLAGREFVEELET